MKRLFIILIMFSLFFGCAHAANEGYQRIMAVPQNNQSPDSTRCVFESDKGKWMAMPMDYFANRIKRSPSDLKITCRNGLGQEGATTVASRMQWEYFWMDFFFLDLCTISGIIDYSTGAFFEYPSIITIDMDKEYF